MTKVKICGITRQEDAALAESLGADFLGFIFVPESPRYADAEHVSHIETKRAKRVGVFRNEPADVVRAIAEIAMLDLVQIHGEIAHDVGLPVIHAFHVRESLPETHTNADYILFDTGGGTGRVFDWNLLAHYERTKPFFLAGGLNPDNAQDAIANAQPFAIDVNSGVEREPGIKDHDKLKLLFERIQR